MNICEKKTEIYGTLKRCCEVEYYRECMTHIE